MLSDLVGGGEKLFVVSWKRICIMRKKIHYFACQECCRGSGWRCVFVKRFDHSLRRLPKEDNSQEGKKTRRMTEISACMNYRIQNCVCWGVLSPTTLHSAHFLGKSCTTVYKEKGFTFLPSTCHCRKGGGSHPAAWHWNRTDSPLKAISYFQRHSRCPLLSLESKRGHKIEKCAFFHHKFKGGTGDHSKK